MDNMSNEDQPFSENEVGVSSGEIINSDNNKHIDEESHSMSNSKLIQNICNNDSSFYHKIRSFIKTIKEWWHGPKCLKIRKMMNAVYDFFRKSPKYTLILIMLIFLIFVIHPNKQDNTHKQKEKQVEKIIQKINLTAEFSTVEYKIKIVHVEKDPNAVGDFINRFIPSFGKKLVGERAMAIVSNVSIKAGIDLSNFSSDRVQIDGSTIVVTLPEAKIISHKIDWGTGTKVSFFSGNMRNDYTLNDVEAAKEQIEKSLTESLSKSNIIEDAQIYAENFIKILLMQLGYSTVIIKFE